MTAVGLEMEKAAGAPSATSESRPGAGRTPQAGWIPVDPAVFRPATSTPPRFPGVPVRYPVPPEADNMNGRDGE